MKTKNPESLDDKVLSILYKLLKKLPRPKLTPVGEAYLKKHGRLPEGDIIIDDDELVAEFTKKNEQ